MKIADAQIHIWSKGTPSGLHRKVSSYTVGGALREMDEAGVHAAVIHPPASWDPDSNAMAVEAARRYPESFAVICQFPPTLQELRHLIQGWKKQPGMLGLRWALLREPCLVD
ncbi:MAG: hypothetical protein FJX33_08725 [Alphaproteobacteria bacterium]|nr:hypothetical protein [Alphaproteobacteria bacterium]